MTTINNDWIIPVNNDNEQVLRNGVVVKRAFGGLNAQVGAPNETGQSPVNICTVSYWYQEYYPTGQVIKTELKTYTLQDLAETEGEDENGAWKQEALAVLTGFVQTLGYPGIINPARDTLSNAVVLPLDAERDYPLRRDTREKIYQ